MKKNLIFTEQFVEERIQLLEFILNFSWVIFFMIFISAFLFFKSKTKRWRVFFVSILIASVTWVYAQHIERFWIKTEFIDLQKGWGNRVVLIADQHLGVYKNNQYMEKVVEKINSIENVDFVVIAGDFTYWPKDLWEEHAALQKIKVPVYAVLGNHDMIQSGFISHKAELTKLFKNFANVTILENQRLETKSGIVVYGLGSHYAHTDDVSFLKNVDPKTEDKVLILTHNPDTTSQPYPDVDLTNSVTMTGHTHCGQIRIPFLYKYAIPTKGDFPNRGPYDLGKKGQLLITCGLGEVGLPLRLFNRPEILVVDL